MVVLQALSEPRKMKEIMNVNDFAETKTLKYEIGRIRNNNLFITIQVKILHHLACIELTVETISIDSFTDKPFIRYDCHLIGERLTLKYI
jgi:hypothetical protein